MDQTNAPRITVFRRAGRNRWEAQWTDPATGRKRTRTLEATDRRTAERAAGYLAAELAAGVSPTAATWSTMIAAYTAAKWPSLAKGSRQKIQTTLNLFARACRPSRPHGLNAATLAKFVADLRTAGRCEATIAGHLRNLAALARWAVRHRYLAAEPPPPPKPRTRARARGRPITAEELDRLLAAAPAIVGQAAAPAWQHLLRGLYVTGLRLSEALALDWTAGPIRLAWTSPPTLEIEAGADKSGRASILPLTPEAAAFFGQTPPGERRGRVFRPTGRDGRRLERLDTVSKIISDMGRRARIVVGTSPTKYASAHDLRRSFALRLAPRIRPALLQILMRHRSISTTLTYYATPDALASAHELWTDLDAHSPPSANSFANSDQHDNNDHDRNP